MEIIVLKGQRNARKTTTLKLLYSKLKKINEQEKINFNTLIITIWISLMFLL